MIAWVLHERQVQTAGDVARHLDRTLHVEPRECCLAVAELHKCRLLVADSDPDLKLGG